jgi:hypothetical protein
LKIVHPLALILTTFSALPSAARGDAEILANAGSSHFKTRGSAIDNRMEAVAGSNPADTR